MKACGKYFYAFLILFVTGLVLPAGTAPAATRDDARPWQGDLPVRPAWLRDHLPGSTLIYARLPHPLGFLASPKGNVMDSALRSNANVRSLQNIQSALVTNVLEYVPGFEEAYIRDFADRLRSPVEVSVMLAPAPSILIAMNLDVESNTGFSDLIKGFSVSGAPISLLGPLDSDGFGQIIGLPIPTAAHFNAQSGQLLLQAGPAVTADSFAAMIETIANAAAHPMHDVESKIDTSGYGWFTWIDAESAIPAAQMFMSPEQMAKLEAAGLDKVRAAAFGWGVANGKGRLRVVADMPRDGERQFLPYISNQPAATAVGELDAVVLLSIPTAAEFSRIEAAALERATEETRNAWMDGKAAVEAEMGIVVEDMLNAIGPEVIGIMDEAGDYAAIRLRDEKLFDEFVEQVSRHSGSRPVERRHGRRTFYHWSFATQPDPLNEEEAEVTGPLGFIFGRQKEHVHWYRDGDFLYMASVPQPLIDRLDSGPNTDIAKWLDQQQKLDVSNSFFAITGSSRKLPRRIYHMYVEMLQAMADISEAEFDVWSMPTAGQVSLPARGAMGFSVSLGDPYLSAELMFENNPLESVFAGDMTSVAAIGILAAIAIPAYQDYTIRAGVAVGLNAAEVGKVGVAEYYQAHGEFPGPSDAAAISAELEPGDYGALVTVVPATGIIVISYAEELVTAGGELYLEPVVAEDGSLSWMCSSSIADKHTPANCRNEPPDLSLGGT